MLIELLFEVPELLIVVSLRTSGVSAVRNLHKYLFYLEK